MEEYVVTFSTSTFALNVSVTVNDKNQTDSNIIEMAEKILNDINLDLSNVDDDISVSVER